MEKGKKNRQKQTNKQESPLRDKQTQRKKKLHKSNNKESQYIVINPHLP
jgi:hypothetical protein